MSEETASNSICIFRPARLDELRAVYDMQNIPFRSLVFANYLPEFDVFEKLTIDALREGKEKLYIMERDNSMAGYGHYYMHDDICDIVVWGRWLKTLMFASLKVAFDTLGVRAINSAVRHDNKRVINAYKHFDGRVIKRELLPFQQGQGIWSRITMVGLLIYELTNEEFRAKEEMFRKQSMPVQIMNS